MGSEVLRYLRYFALFQVVSWYGQIIGVADSTHTYALGTLALLMILSPNHRL